MKKVKFADQTIYTGQALIFLATEAKILREAGRPVTDTKARIKEVLDAINRLDRMADQRFGAASVLDGFFVRDDVSGPGDPRLGGRAPVVESDWQFPDKENASPNGDQIFGLMYGLWTVVNFSGEPELVAEAKAISGRLYDYAKRNHFVLTLPNGQPTRRGSDARWLASLMHGLNKSVTGTDLFRDSRIKVAGRLYSLEPLAAFWDDRATADSFKNLVGRNFEIPFVDQDIQLNSFAVHIVLTAIAPGEVWTQTELEAVALKSNHHLSALMYCAAHTQALPLGFQRQDIVRILAACPSTGLGAAVDRNTGWHKDNRWIRSLSLDNPSDGTEEYNGVDWLILHNLDQLIFVGR